VAGSARADDRSPRRPLEAATVAIAVVALLAGLALALAVVLSFAYVPSGAQAWDDPSLGGGGTAWTTWHRWSTVVWLVAAGASVAVVAARASTARPGRRGGVALAAAVASALAALVALSTRALVQWDQLALWAVAVGGGISGYWAALDDGVRFVLVGGVEVGRGAYGIALAAHLLAHVVGVGAAVGALVAWTSDRRAEHAAAPVAPPAVPDLPGAGSAGPG